MSAACAPPIWHRATRWHVYRDANSMVSKSIVSPGFAGNYAMNIRYRIASGGWGGIERKWSSPKNWSGHSKFAFAFYGNNTGNRIRVEIYDDRGPGSASDSSERYVYRFTDNFTGWRNFSLLWSAFSRRTDWQPAGAPNNGLTLTQVWGYNFSPISGHGVFRTDQNRLVK